MEILLIILLSTAIPTLALAIQYFLKSIKVEHQPSKIRFKHVSSINLFLGLTSCTGLILIFFLADL